MIYQLPNGKVLWLTTEEYLNLTDDELNLISSLGYGDTANSPWTGSVLPGNTKQKQVSDPDGDAYDYNVIYEDHGSDLTIIMSINDFDIEDLDIPDNQEED